VAKPEWGFKRTCLSCGAKFYDMKKDPIVCPKCEAVFDPDAATKLKRSRQAPEEKVAKPKKEAPVVEDDALEDDEDDDDDDTVLEDTSDLDDDPNVPGVGGDDDEET